MVVALLACLFVGFNEELVFRGIGVVGLRARVAEWQVFLYTTLAFGLAHGLNIVFGQGLGPTVAQVVLACAFGAAMYVVRRVSGTLLLCMALHALWDFTIFVRVGAHAVPTTTAIGGSVPRYWRWWPRSWSSSRYSSAGACSPIPGRLLG